MHSGNIPTWTGDRYAVGADGVRAHRLMTALAEGTRGGGTSRRTSVYAIFPNVNVTSKAAIAAAVISHGNGGLERLEGMEVVTSTRRKGDRRPSIVLRARKDFRLWNQPLSCSMIAPPHKSPSFEEQKPWPYCLTRLPAPLSPSR